MMPIRACADAVRQSGGTVLVRQRNRASSWQGFVRTMCWSLCGLLMCSCDPSFGEGSASEYLRRGDRYVEGQHYREAVVEYMNAAQRAPHDAAIQWTLARTALKAVDLDNALKALRKVLELDPLHIEGRAELARLHMAAGKTAEAARIARDLLAAHPQHAAGYLLQGDLEAGAGRFQEAIALYERACELDETLLPAMLAIANLLVLQQEPSRALSWYERAKESHPESIDVHIALGNYFFARGRERDGEGEFTRAIELGKQDEAVRLAVAVQHLARGRTDHAIEQLHTLDREKHSKKARAFLAEVLFEAGLVAEGRTVVAALARSDPADATTLYLEGRVAFLEHRWADARRLFEKAVEWRKDKAAPYMYLGHLDMREGRFVQGEALLRQALQLDPDNPRSHLILADAYLGQHTYNGAATEALEVLRRNPASVEAAVIYGDAQFLQDNWAQAEAMYRALADQLPASPLGYRKLGLVAQRQGLSAKAASLFAQAIERAPGDADLMLYLRALVAADRSMQAADALKQFLSHAPQDPARWEMAGKFHRMQGRMDKAADAWRTMSRILPDSARPHYELGEIFMKQNKPVPAEASWRQAIENDEGFAPARNSLGMLLTSQGKIEEADEQYRKALESEPRNVVAANNLAANLLGMEATSMKRWLWDRRPRRISECSICEGHGRLDPL